MNKYAETKQEDTIYSVLEMGVIKKFNKIKIFFLHPIVVALDKIGVSPNMISVSSAVIAGGALFVAYMSSNPIYFIIGIWLHLIVDSLDGTLARYQSKNSPNGAIIDAMCDHVGIISASLFAYMFMIINLVSILIFVGLYTALILIVFYLLKHKSSYRFIIRPRFYFYVALTIDVFRFIDITYYIVLISSAVMFVEVVAGIVKVLRLKKIHL